jgi:2,4-dienoyl-CoA reductase-like NADH-dependent reductase (Old Yellow Enzyme family)
MATPNGAVTDELVDLHRWIALGGAGMAITGHMYVDPIGQATERQTGIHADDLIPGLRHLTDSVHGAGGRVFAQLAHAGSQSRLPRLTPIGPSAVRNPLTGVVPKEMSEPDIEKVIEAFARAARRAVLGGFDGVHLHGANGYLISEFMSPSANHRTDLWGGSAARRAALPTAIIAAIREVVPRTFPVTMKVGLGDAVSGGNTLEDSIAMVSLLAGLDGVEVSCGVMGDVKDSAGLYVGVDRRRAARDLLVVPLLGRPGQEAYFRDQARALRAVLEIPIMLTGGIRSPDTMRSIISSRDADLIGMARPLIREPDLPAKLRIGDSSMALCTSCNLCMRHSGHEPLQCWRSPKTRLVDHVRLETTRWLRSALRSVRSVTPGPSRD